MKIADAILTAAKFAGKPGLVSGIENVVIDDGQVVAHSLRSGAICSCDDHQLSAATEAKALARMVQAAGDNVTLKRVGTQLEVAGDDGTFRVACVALDSMPARPALPNGSWHRIPGSQWQQIKHVLWAVSTDITRDHMCGVNIRSTYLQACDGHVASQRQIETNVCALLGLQAMLFDPDPVLTIEGDIEICSKVNDRRLFVRSADDPANVRFTTIIDAVFAPLERVLDPLLGCATIVVNRKQLLAACKSATAIQRGGDLGLTLVLTDFDELQLSGDCADRGDNYHHELPVTFGERAPERRGKVQINVKYLIHALSELEAEQVELGIEWKPDGSLDPVVVRSSADHSMSVIMPMRAD